jgi:IS30 family transposase
MRTATTTAKAAADQNRLELPTRLRDEADNDTAFAQHALLRTMRAMTTWFCDAYASWQKGGVENANGRLRRWLPRQIDIDKVCDEEIQDIIITANLTPRKCLGFKTPFQAILKELGKDVQIRFT